MRFKIPSNYRGDGVYVKAYEIQMVVMEEMLVVCTGIYGVSIFYVIMVSTSSLESNHHRHPRPKASGITVVRHGSRGGSRMFYR